MKITFFTTSTFSDIQEVHTSCIRKFFPDSQHIKFDGRTGWFTVWYNWLDYAINVDSDWYVHIDEDCFITSSEKIYELIDKMTAEGIDIAGPPDGHHEYRSGNHMAYNSFFMIMNRKCIEAWYNKTHTPQFKEEWIEEYPYDKKNGTRYEYNMEFGSSGKPLGMIWKPETEPYYDFFWVLKEVGIKFYYLEPIFGNELQTTDLLEGTITHLWHQRERFSNTIVSPLHTIPNIQRYNMMLEKIENIINNYV
jgi:hypothetical protein